MRARPLRERVEALIGPADENGCRPWLGQFGQRGTPTIQPSKGKSLSARRLVWEYVQGTMLEPEQWISVSCETRVCMVHLSLRERDPKKRFWEYVDKSSGPEGCWLWTGGKQKGGYGGFRINPKKTVRAHRFAWELLHGPIPPVNEDGVEVVACHRCDVPLCVNPAHLFLGTDGDNAADKVSKGRQARGEKLRAANRAAHERRKAQVAA